MKPGGHGLRPVGGRAPAVFPMAVGMLGVGDCISIPILLVIAMIVRGVASPAVSFCNF